MTLKNKFVIAILVFLVLLSVVILVFFDNSSENATYEEHLNAEENTDDDFFEEDTEEEKTIEKKVVTNYGRYFSLVSTVNQIYDNINFKSYSTILNNLSKNYVNTNNLKLNNIDTFIEFRDDFYNSSIIDIKEVYITDSIAAYFIEVYLIMDVLNWSYDMLEKYTEYIVIFYDENNLTYSFMPSNEEEFNQDYINGDDYLYSLTSISSNSNNSYTVNSTSTSAIADLYYNKFKFNYINGIDGYEDLIYGSLPSDFYLDSSGNIEKYYYDSSKSLLELLDSYGFTYYFEIESVLDYQVKVS